MTFSAKIVPRMAILGRMAARHKCRLILPGLAVVALLLAAGPSRASLQIALQEAGVNSGAITVVGTAADFTAVSFSGTYGDFDVTIQGGSSKNGVSLSKLNGSTNDVTNSNYKNAGTNTLHIWVTPTNYTLPIGSPLQVESGLAGIVSTGTLGLSNIYQAWADRNNNLFGTLDFTNNAQSATANGSTFDTGSAFGLFYRNASPYSVTAEATFTLSAGGDAGFQSHVNLTPTPAPAGLVLALTGLPCLGLGWLVRRRKEA